MKILGIGVDVVNNRRIQPLIKNQNFIKRTFGPNELKFSKNKVNRTNFFAKRFAAKVALSKSFGTGIRDNLNLTGTHVGCEHGVCGSCTIKIDGVTSRSCLKFGLGAPLYDFSRF